MSSVRDTQVEVHTFSARQFYREYVQGSSERTGIHRSALLIPSSGFHHIRGSSLEWIDGLHADTLDVQRFMDSLASNELPAPLLSSVPHMLGRSFTYTAPEILAHSARTILASFGIGPILINRALESPVVACPSCKKLAYRSSYPHLVTDAILNEHQGQRISLFAIGSTEKLTPWALRAGFTVEPDDFSALTRSRIDQGVCTRDLITQLSPVLRSLWQIPDLGVVCTSDSTLQVYSRQGWCLHCRKAIPPVERAALERALNSKVAPARPFQEDLLASTLSLQLSSHCSIADLLSVPISDLNSLSIECIQRIQEILDQMHLASHTFGELTEDLTSAEVARLSLAVSLYNSKETSPVVLLDLPQSLCISPKSEGFLNRRHYAETTFICIAQHAAQASLDLTSDSSLLDCVDTVPKPDEIISLSSPLLNSKKVCQQLTTLLGRSSNVADASGTDSPDGVHSLLYEIPTFPKRVSGRQTIGEALGLLVSVAQLYASSVDARVAGLSARDFTLGSSSKHSHVCQECKGLGVILMTEPSLPRPRATPCLLCRGARFKEPVCSTLFRGVSYSSLLNSPLAELRGMLKAFARCRDALLCSELLGLLHLPLGMPVALLSSSERRRVMVAEAVNAASANKQPIIVIENPYLGLSSQEALGLRTLQRSPQLAGKVRWIELHSTRPTTDLKSV